jgi:hypothetical protein
MLDIHQLKRLVSEPKSGALFEYFFLSPTLKTIVVLVTSLENDVPSFVSH